MPPFAALLLALALGHANVVSGGEWNYKLDDPHGPLFWEEVCHTGKRQSPIDIVDHQTSPVQFDPFHFRHYSRQLGNDVTLHNNGHTIVMGLGRVSPKIEAAVRGGGLEKVYVLDHIHFHAGAEHTINGIRHPLEAHLVHREQHSENVSQALTKRDGIAVLGVLFHVSKEPNKSLRPLFEALRKLEGADKGQKISMKISSSPMALSAFLPDDTERFYRYYGSLTTPGCHEDVVWTVLENSLPISEEELRLFRVMPEDNFRPAQNLNHRFVLRNNPGSLSSHSSTSSASVVSMPLALVLLSSLLTSLLMRSGTRATH
ncbi:putative carbonic anhydrase 3 [Hetaerina americana]|uniref:putative carbonic anhydrase 3 n=1 Tax=Hetaerina americana TaxID=62018 RepID=UPI003A7F2182